MSTKPTTLADWVSLIRNLEKISDDTNAIVAKVELEIAESQKLPEYTEKERLLIDE